MVVEGGCFVFSAAQLADATTTTTWRSCGSAGCKTSCPAPTGYPRRRSTSGMLKGFCGRQVSSSSYFLLSSIILCQLFFCILCVNIKFK